MSIAGGTPAATDGDSAALDQIAELLRADARGEWGPELSEAIAEIVQATGRTTGDTA